MKEAITKEYEELYSKIAETEVEKWTRLVDVERECFLSQNASNLTNCGEVQRKMQENASIHDHVARDRYQKFKNTLSGLDKPMMQMRDDISMIKNKFESWSSFHFILQLVILTFYKELRAKRLSDGCPK